MKTSEDPRHKKRQRIIQDLFSLEFHNQPVDRKVEDIINQKKTLDNLICKAAPDYPIEKINKIDLAILRLAVYELCIVRKEPPTVIIDESIELAKEFGNDTSSSFINGVLGHIVKSGESKVKQ